MTVRLIVAVVVLSSAPAFAPAPFPRASRDGDRNGIDMKRFQGTWKVISMEIVQAGPDRYCSQFCAAQGSLFLS